MKPAFRIRRFRDGDLEQVAAIEKACFRRHAWPRDLLRWYADSCPELFLVVLVRDRIAGSSITCGGRHRAELVSIAVHPDFRGSGIAKALLRSTLRRLRLRGVRRLGLAVKVTNRPAIRLYETFG